MEGKTEKEHWQEFKEEYTEQVKKYCLANCDVPIQKNGNGWIINVNLKQHLYVAAGNFDSDMVADELEKGEFPFDDIDQEGWWHVQILMKYYNGDDDEPSFMEVLLTESVFMYSFQEHDKQQQSLFEEKDSLPF